MPDSMPKDMPDRTRRSDYVSFMPEYIWKYLLYCQNKYRKRFARTQMPDRMQEDIDDKMLTWRPSGPRARCPGEEKGIVRLARLFLPCIVYELQSKYDETNWPLLCMTALMNRFSVIVHKLGVLEGATGKGSVHTERLRWFKFTHFLNLWNFIPRDHALMIE